MSRQLLFCVETGKQAKTDNVYINETLNRYYQIGSDIRIRYIYLNGKSNYNKNDIRMDIKTQTAQYLRNGETHVIYCIDTDRHDIDAGHLKDLRDIEEYCAKNGYEFVWFSRDIEDVYWGEQIHKDEKVQKARQFRSGKKIEAIPEKNLRARTITRHKSNILLILDDVIKSHQK